MSVLDPSVVELVEKRLVGLDRACFLPPIDGRAALPLAGAFSCDNTIASKEGHKQRHSPSIAIRVPGIEESQGFDNASDLGFHIEHFYSLASDHVHLVWGCH